MSSIKVNIFTPQELNHSSYIQTGLFELEKEKFLSTKVKLSLSKRLGTIKVANNKLLKTNEPHPKTSFYELEDAGTGKKIKFATDLYDASYSFSAYALDHCDFVFKRNYEIKNIEKLPKEFQNKIFPLGLTFKVKPEINNGFFRLFLGLLLSNLRISIKIDRYLLKRVYRTINKQLHHWKDFKKSPNLAHYGKNTNTVNTQNTILFQTRCFVNEDSQDVKEIHQQRYNIIKLLREKFPQNFVGGFIPSRIVDEKYKKAITNLPTNPLAYLNEIKKAKMVIYTRGLLDSPAWKMAEYLSQGKVIIAEKLTAELPIPLTHRKEILFFENEDDIPNLIQEVINDDEMCNVLSKNAKMYFDQNVHPKENVKRILTLILQNNL